MLDEYFIEPGQKDRKLLSITFTERDPSMHIVCNNLDSAKNLKGRIIGLKKMCEMDNPYFQNFNVTSDKTPTTVIITGNVYNGVELLFKENLMSKELYQNIHSDNKIKSILEKSKKTVLKENLPKVIQENPPKNNSLTNIKFYENRNTEKGVNQKARESFRKELSNFLEEELLSIKRRFSLSPEDENCLKEEAIEIIKNFNTENKTKKNHS